MALTNDDMSSITDAHTTTYELDDVDDNNQGAGSGQVTTLPRKMQQAPPLFGRSDETIALLQAYQRLLLTQKAETVIVHGESGSGKTALIDMLRNPVFDTSGYFVAGKYFNQDSAVEEPYSAIMAAFSDLCDLVVQSDEFDIQKREAMTKALGTNVQLLVKSISNLLPLVEDDLSKDDVDIEVTFGMFKIACKTFLRAVSSEKHPVVVFLDDIQWADEGSRKLIQMFLQDLELKNVMFILAYREEESAQVLSATGVLSCDALQDHQIDIKLPLLDVSDVHQIVVSIMGSNTDQIRHLSDLVAKRTFGNPLHVVTFMEIAEREGLLMYDTETGIWVFDTNEIRQAIMISETLAGLLTRKIGRLPIDLEGILKFASFIGYYFDEVMLKSIVCSTCAKTKSRPFDIRTCQSEIGASLSLAISEGFIEKSNNGYQFVHDKIQTAFRSLIDEQSEVQLHQLVGEAFLASKNDKSDVYRAAVHLNCAPAFLSDDKQRAKLARINLEAAKYCEKMSAFDKAVAALENGLNVLGLVGLWSGEYYSLTFEIMEALARAQLIMGDFKSCKETTREALLHGRTAEEKVNLLLINVEVRMAGNEIDDAVITANRSLSVLGVKMPRRVTVRHVLAKLMKVKFMLRHKTDDDILNLPFTQGILAANAVKLLMHLCSYCLLKDEADMAVFCALKATELTLRNGLSYHSPGAFAVYGVAEVSVGNIDRAYRFGKLAVAMLDHMDSREVECSTVAFALKMLLHRKEYISELVTPLHQISNSGFQHAGDIYYATYSAAQCYSMHVHLGTHLADLESAMRETDNRLLELGQDALLGWLQPVFQYVINMQTDASDSWEDIAILSGEIMDEDEYLSLALEKNHAAFGLTCCLWKGKMAVEFGQFSLAASTVERCISLYGIDAIRVSWAAPAYYFDRARVHYGLFESSGFRLRRYHLKKGRKYQRLLQQMHTAGCPNASSFLVFLVTQESTLRKKSKTATALRAAYDSGIGSLIETKSFILEGFLSERAGFDFAKLGLLTEAERYFQRALHIYQNEWGATAKYTQLKETSSQVLARLRSRRDIRIAGVYGRCIDITVPLASNE